MEFPVGWDQEPIDWDLKDIKSTLAAISRFVTVDLAPALPGILISTVAISLGATFWFDVLNKLFRLRTQLKPAEEKESKKKKKDAATTQT